MMGQDSYSLIDFVVWLTPYMALLTKGAEFYANFSGFTGSSGHAILKSATCLF